MSNQNAPSAWLCAPTPDLFLEPAAGPLARPVASRRIAHHHPRPSPRTTCVRAGRYARPAYTTRSARSGGHGSPTADPGASARAHCP